jgi:hypothetical protein
MSGKPKRPLTEERLSGPSPHGRSGRIVLLAGGIVVALLLGWLAGSALYQLLEAL